MRGVPEMTTQCLKRGSSVAAIKRITSRAIVVAVGLFAVICLSGFSPFVTDEKYAADGIPQLGNIRTKVQLYLHENGYLPGLNRYRDGTVIRATNGLFTQAYGNSVLLSDSPLPDAASPVLPAATHLYGQCMNRNGERFAQRLTMVPYGTRTTWEDIWAPVADHQGVNHYAEDLDIDDSDLTGKYCRPEHFVYAVPVGRCEGDKQLFVVAVLGNGDKLPSGTGYAVLECHNPANVKAPRIVAKWQRWIGRYEEKDCTTGQLVLSYFGADTGIVAPDLETEVGREAMANHICVPLDLASDDPTKITQAMHDLRALGWADATAPRIGGCACSRW
jgi:hypothetical protein